jgi:AhpC/TSA family
VWQALYGELKDQGFAIVAVALDVAEAARPWVEAAKPGYTVLIDSEHRIAELYNIVNVPQAVWIDEAGRIVRPPETAGAYEAFRFRDRTSNQIPAAELAKKASAQQRYLDAVRDWVARGAESRFVMASNEARAHLAKPTPEIARAHAHFRLGAYLLTQGRTDEAARQMAMASELHPASWAIWRQAAAKNDLGLAAGPEFWERVAALGGQRYYPPPPMQGMP